MSSVPLKILAALLLTAAGLGAGACYAHRLAVRRTFLAAFCTFLQNLSTALRYRGGRIDTLINSSGELFSFPNGEWEQPFAESWRLQISGFPKKWRLTPQDMQLLTDFGERLGTTDADGQLAHIAHYREIFAARLDEARQEAAQKAKLYKTLGLFGGVSAALLLW